MAAPAGTRPAFYRTAAGAEMDLVDAPGEDTGEDIGNRSDFQSSSAGDDATFMDVGAGSLGSDSRTGSKTDVSSPA